MYGVLSSGLRASGNGDQSSCARVSVCDPDTSFEAAWLDLEAHCPAFGEYGGTGGEVVMGIGVVPVARPEVARGVEESSDEDGGEGSEDGDKGVGGGADGWG